MHTFPAKVGEDKTLSCFNSQDVNKDPSHSLFRSTVFTNSQASSAVATRRL